MSLEEWLVELSVRIFVCLCVGEVDVVFAGVVRSRWCVVVLSGWFGLRVMGWRGRARLRRATASCRRRWSGERPWRGGGSGDRRARCRRGERWRAWLGVRRPLGLASEGWRRSRRGPECDRRVALRAHRSARVGDLERCGIEQWWSWRGREVERLLGEGFDGWATGVVVRLGRGRGGRVSVVMVVAIVVVGGVRTSGGAGEGGGVGAKEARSHLVSGLGWRSFWVWCLNLWNLRWRNRKSFRGWWCGLRCQKPKIRCGMRRWCVRTCEQIMLKLLEDIREHLLHRRTWRFHRRCIQSRSMRSRWWMVVRWKIRRRCRWKLILFRWWSEVLSGVRHWNWLTVYLERWMHSWRPSSKLRWLSMRSRSRARRRSRRRIQRLPHGVGEAKEEAMKVGV